MKLLFSLIMAVVLTGCASDPYVYYVKPTPLKSNQTKYFLKDVKVTLKLGHGAIPGDKTFASQEKLLGQFKKYLVKHLKKHNILAKKSSTETPNVEIYIDYTRRFNYGGKALNKPEVSHKVIVSNKSGKIASFALNNYTTKYAYFEDTAVNLQIALFTWDAEDEVKDVELISEMLAEDLANLGS